MILLAKLLRVPLAHAVGMMEMLFHWTARYAPRGDIGRWPDATIAQAMRWAGAPHALVDRMATAGWVDRHRTHRLVLHDWKDHADEAVRKQLKRQGQSFVEPEPCPDILRTMAGPQTGLPEPEPVASPVSPDMDSLRGQSQSPQAAADMTADGYLGGDHARAGWIEKLWAEIRSLYPKQGRIRSRMDRQLLLSEIDTEEQGAALLAGLHRQIASERWMQGYVPDLSRFLRERMWEDEPPAPRPAPKSRRDETWEMV